MKTRIERDTMGDVHVPAEAYWGAQTERSRNNFKIGPEASMPIEIIRAFAYLKKAAAMTNAELGVLAQEKSDLIGRACDEILAGQHDLFTLMTHYRNSWLQHELTLELDEEKGEEDATIESVKTRVIRQTSNRLIQRCTTQTET